jgi:hypothetical protein
MRSALIGFVGTAMLVTSIAGCGSNNGQVATNTPVGPVLQSTQYIQVERLARPAVKEAFEAFESHDTSNRTSPYNDPTLASSIQSFTSMFRAPVYGATLAKVLIPDVIKEDTSQSSQTTAYLGIETAGATGNTVGGRGLTDDVIDISLGAIFGTTLSTIPATASSVPADDMDDPCLATENLPAASNTNTKAPPGLAQYANTTTIAAAKHESATFPYLGTPN